MACCKVLFCFLLALFFISSSATRLFHPFSAAGQALKEEAKEQNKAGSTDKIEIIDRNLESKQFSVTGKWTLPVEARNLESKQSPSSGKRALIQEGWKAIKASIKRHDEIPYESKRLSPGGPDPHHH